MVDRPPLSELPLPHALPAACPLTPATLAVFVDLQFQHHMSPIRRRGTLVALQPGAAFCAPPVLYIADHDTTPQQVVKNDTTSHLVRTLQNKKMKEEAKRKQSKAAGAASSRLGSAPFVP